MGMNKESPEEFADMSIMSGQDYLYLLNTREKRSLIVGTTTSALPGQTQLRK